MVRPKGRSLTNPEIILTQSCVSLNELVPGFLYRSDTPIELFTESTLFCVGIVFLFPSYYNTEVCLIKTTSRSLQLFLARKTKKIAPHLQPRTSHEHTVTTGRTAEQTRQRQRAQAARNKKTETSPWMTLSPRSSTINRLEVVGLLFQKRKKSTMDIGNPRRCMWLHQH